jgi:dGTPase
MACLMHDIGNPPFGHFGEAAINDWFRHRLFPSDAASQPLSDDRCVVRDLRLREGEEALNELRRKVRQDLCHFEGNAQGIRLVHSLMRMNLTWAQVGCILKYTRPAWWQGEPPASHDYLMKKPGYYFSEEAYIERLRKELSLTPHGRFPLTWIMEAADDISYCVADLEDAVEKRIFSVEELYQRLYDAWGTHEKGSLFSQVVENAWEKSRSNSLRRSAEDQFFMYLRVNTLNKLVPYAASRFIDNLPLIYTGDFNQALLGWAKEHFRFGEDKNAVCLQPAVPRYACFRTDAFAHQPGGRVRTGRTPGHHLHYSVAGRADYGAPAGDHS